MRNKRRKKHRKHREVDYEEFNEDIISRNKRETFNLDIKLRFKLCEDPNGDPLTPGMSENYVLPVLLPVIISYTESLHWVGPESEIKPKVIFITHHENYLGWFIKDIGALTFESVVLWVGVKRYGSPTCFMRTVMNHEKKTQQLPNPA